MEDHRRRDDAEVRDVDQQRKTAKVTPDRGRVDPLKSEKFQEARSQADGYEMRSKCVPEKHENVLQ